jgi:glycosyltransferase involved in cell wall biosynthesis
MPDVILPALDEAAAIPAVLAGLPPEYRPIVVDNGSTDETASVARMLGATVVSEPQRGFGAACFAGLVAATAEIVCFMDCDGSFRGADLCAVVEPVAAARCDLVLGARRAAPGAWPPHARLANRVLTRELRRRTGIRLRDLGPMRAARRDSLLSLGLEDRRFGWPLEMVLRASRAGWRIDEVEVAYSPRVGRSKVTGTVRGTARAVHDMARLLR